MLSVLIALIVLVLFIVRLLYVAQKWMGPERTLLGMNILALVFVILSASIIFILGDRA